MRKGIPWRIVAEVVGGRRQWKLYVEGRMYLMPFQTWFAADLERRRALRELKALQTA